MENQSKVIVIERNKFAALVKSHWKSQTNLTPLAKKN